MLKQPVLIPDAQTRAMLAALRSLGRAGYDTHAVAASPDAVGLHSRYARHKVVGPGFGDPAFCDWLAAYCRENAIAMIVPSSGVLHAVRPRFHEFSPLLPVSSDPAAVYRAGDKIAAYRAYEAAPAQFKLLEHHPGTIVATRDSIPGYEALARLSLPIYVKASFRDADTEADDGVWECNSHAEALQRIMGLLSGQYRQVLVQAGVDGVQVCVGVLMGHDGPLAINCVRDGHPRPHSKGTMSLRHSWWHQKIVDDAVARLKALEWIGCAMVEYRWVPSTDEFNVIEINARFWRYLHLDLHAGVDFPRLMAEWFLEGRTSGDLKPLQGVSCRDTFPGEIAQLVNAFRDRGTGFAAKSRELAGFCARSLDPRVHSDLSFPGDRRLYFRELGQFILSELRLR
jgi:hypothetical protein